MKIAAEFSPRDWWIGFSWRRTGYLFQSRLDVFIFVVPMIGIHLSFVRDVPADVQKQRVDALGGLVRRVNRERRNGRK